MKKPRDFMAPTSFFCSSMMITTVEKDTMALITRNRAIKPQEPARRELRVAVSCT